MQTRYMLREMTSTLPIKNAQSLVGLDQYSTMGMVALIPSLGWRPQVTAWILDCNLQRPGRCLLKRRCAAACT